MSMKISRRDWERLSAYIDMQLSARERARLEKRLQSDAALQAALDDLHTMRGALRRLPKVRAPRDFRLTPEMAGQRVAHAPRLFPTFRLASLVASLLLVLLVLGDVFGFGGMALSPRQELAVPSAEMAVEVADELPAAEEPAAIVEEAAPEAEAIVEGEPESLAVEKAAEDQAGAALEAGEAPSEQTSPPTETAAPAATPLPPAPDEGDTVNADIPQQQARPLRIVQVFEIILAAVVLISGGAALYFRRRERR